GAATRQAQRLASPGEGGASIGSLPAAAALRLLTPFQLILIIMPHVFEPASSGRAKCRGCGKQIEKETLRFGERIPNPYAEGEATLWFHPLCAAYKRPEAMLETLEQEKGNVPEVQTLERAA